MTAAACGGSGAPVTGTAASSPAAAASTPATGAGFYRYPSPGTLAKARNGQVLASQPMRVTEPLRLASSRALRIMYRSQGLRGQPVAVTGFLLIPRGHPPRRGWPVIAWSHGTAGVGPNCAPSRSPSLYLPGAYEYQRLITRLLSNGFAVVGTDYPGLGFPGQLHPYVQPGPEGRSVVDSVLAARHLIPQLGRRWFSVGHSQGGQSALAAGEIAQRAQGLQFLGTVSFAPASHVALIWDSIARVRPPLRGVDFVLAAYAAYVAVSARLYDPGLRYTDVLSPQLAGQIPAAKRLCLLDLAMHLATVHPPLTSILNPSGASSPRLRRFFAQTEPATRRSAGPILLLQGGRDDQIPPRATGRLKAELCRLGDVVQYRTYASANHDTLLAQAYPGTVHWLRDRLSGIPASQTC
ncbi:MAG: alpha/beta hydrolase [Nocardiopsaceae bacterium]|jgi:alpha-beta hydrolase superfamily lysophospholipase|nr:alpha/beta hydrolase [Nocardiopsaceae bacterium]